MNFCVLRDRPHLLPVDQCLPSAHLLTQVFLEDAVENAGSSFGPAAVLTMVLLTLLMSLARDNLPWPYVWTLNLCPTTRCTRKRVAWRFLEWQPAPTRQYLPVTLLFKTMPWRPGAGSSIMQADSGMVPLGRWPV